MIGMIQSATHNISDSVNWVFDKFVDFVWAICMYFAPIKNDEDGVTWTIKPKSSFWLKQRGRTIFKCHYDGRKECIKYITNADKERTMSIFVMETLMEVFYYEDNGKLTSTTIGYKFDRKTMNMTILLPLTDEKLKKLEISASNY